MRRVVLIFWRAGNATEGRGFVESANQKTDMLLKFLCWPPYFNWFRASFT